MEGREPDPMHSKYSVQPGILDLNHLELVALVRVSRGSLMPHFRSIPPSRRNGVLIPQRMYEHGTGRGLPNNRDPVLFVRHDGSYMPVTAALSRDYSGLIDRDLEVLGAYEAINVRFEVSTTDYPR